MLFGLPTGWLLRNKASASVIEQRERREIETEVTQELLRSNWDCFFVLDSNPAARGIHVANVVFAGTNYESHKLIDANCKLNPKHVANP